MKSKIQEISALIEKEGRDNPLALKIEKMLEELTSGQHLQCDTPEINALWEGMRTHNNIYELTQYFAENLYKILNQDEALIFVSECFNNNDELIHIAIAGHPELMRMVFEFKEQGVMPSAIKNPAESKNIMLDSCLIHFENMKQMTLGALSDETIAAIEQKAGVGHYYGFPVSSGDSILLTFSFLFRQPLSQNQIEYLEQLMKMARHFFIILIQRQQSEKLNQQFQEVFDLGDFAFALFSAEGQLLKANITYKKLFNQLASDYLFDPTFLSIFGINSPDKLMNGDVYSFDVSKMVNEALPGINHFAGGRITPVMRSENNIAYYDFFIQSQSEEQRLRESMLANEQKYQRIFNHIQDVYFEVQMDGTIIELSPSIVNYISIPRESLIGKNIIDLYKDPTQRQEYLYLLQQKGRVDNYHVDFVAPNGRVMNTIVFASIVDRGTENQRIVGSMIDVSEQVLQHKIIKESEIKFRSLFDKSPIGIMICDTSGKIIEINGAMLKSLGSTSSEKTKQINVFTFENLVKSGISKAMLDVLQLGEPRVFENEYQSAWGVNGYFRLFVNAIPDARGQTQYVMLMAEDITDLRNKDVQLRQTEERFLDIYNNTSDLIYTMDFAGNFTSVNPVAEKWLGYNFSSLQNTNMSQFVSHDSTKRAAENIKLKLLGNSSQTTYEVTAFTRNGEKMILEINSFLRFKDQKPIEVFGIARDITERKKHEELIQTALRERETLIMEVHHRVKNNLQLILSMIKMYKYTFTEERVIQSFNDIMQKILAISAVHEDFYFSNNMKEVNFSKYINTIVCSVIEQYDSRNRVEYHIDADNINGNIDMAVPVGLILSELLSNSIRYADKKNNTISLDILLHKANGITELVCKDNGPGIPEEVLMNPKQYLGLELVKLLAENQLNGTIKVNSGVDGTEVIIRF